MDAHQELRAWWEETSASVIPTPTLESEIQVLERRYAIHLPNDFKEYLLTSCPLEDAWDDHNSTWWNFGRIRNIPEEYKQKVSNAQIAAREGQYLFFADHCIWCWAWAISCADDDSRGKVAVIDGVRDRFVADSFTEFVQKYVKDFRSVC